MMPMAPTSLMAMPTSKPKIGFSIDSIVGNGLAKSPPHFSPNSEGSDHPLSPLSDSSFHNDHYRGTRLPTSPNELQRALRLPNNCSPNEIQLRINRYQQSQSPTPSHNNDNNNHHNHHHNAIHQHLRNNSITRLPESPPSSEINLKNSDNLNSCNNNKNNNSLSSSSSSPPPPPTSHHQTRLLSASPNDQHTIRRSRSPSPQPPPGSNKGPIVVPGIPAGLVRPFPVGHPGLNDIKTVPPYMNPSAEMMAAHNPHFLAAQFQMAAALAHGQGQGFPPGGMGQHPAHMGNPNMPRDSYPLYPWLLSRHGRIFPHRFPGSKFSNFF